jgi:surfactin synthase thioesterase subunit
MAGTTILCLPHAGAGATVYRLWPHLPELDVRLAPLQLPGREERFADPLGESFEDTVLDAFRQAEGLIDGTPLALFGHSFGAVLAYELTRRLEHAGHRVRQVVVSGSGHPGQSLGRHSAPLADEEFIAAVEQLAGYTHPALTDPDMRELVLPALRSDVEQHEAYRPASTVPIQAPITVYRGGSDHLVSEQDCQGWAAWTTGGCAYRTFPGGHMYLAEDAATVLRALAEDCSGQPVGTVSAAGERR